MRPPPPGRPVKVIGLDTYFLSAPLPQAVRTSTHRISRVSEVVVKLTTDAGHVGIGEAHGPVPVPGGPGRPARGERHPEAITPLVVGQDPFDVERIWQDLFALTYTSVRGIPTLARQQRPLVTAMSAIDIALWDLKGKAIGRPVHALLGGALRRRVPAYVTGFYYRDGEKPDDLVREAAMYVEQGYRTVKVKVGGLTPEADAERVGRIRKAVGRDVAIMLDANQGWNLPDRGARGPAVRARTTSSGSRTRCPGTTSGTRCERLKAADRTSRSRPARPSTARSGCARCWPRGWSTT